MIQKRKQRSQVDVRVTAMQLPGDRARKNQFMTQGSTPLSIPRSLGNLISSVVERFASQNKLQSEAWYHDEPRWMVWEEADDGIVREVQIGAFHGKSDDELCFIPHAYSFVNDQLRATEEKPTGRKVLTLPLPALQNSIDGGADEIKEQLRIAWSRASNFKGDDLVATRKA